MHAMYHFDDNNSLKKVILAKQIDKSPKFNNTQLLYVLILDKDSLCPKQQKLHVDKGEHFPKTPVASTLQRW